MKNIRLVMLTILLVLCTIMTMATPAAAKTTLPVDNDGTLVLPPADITQPSEVWIDDDYTPATPGWGVTHFDKIQDGIDAVVSGGAVKVAEGTYYENVKIEDKDVYLKGGYSPDFSTWDPNSNNSTIDGNGAGCTIVVDALGGEIVGFSIIGGNPGMSLGGLYGYGIKVYNNNIFNNPGHGLDLEHAWSCNLSNNKIHDNGGLGINKPSGSSIVNNEIWGNQGGGIGAGWGGGGGTIDGNTIRNNEGDGIFFGMAWEGWDTTISNNVITGNSGDGIEVYETPVDIISNIIMDNDGWGVEANQLDGEIVNNLVAGNKGGGMDFFWCSGTKVVNNTIAYNLGGGGINFAYSTISQLVNNIIWGNTPLDLPNGTATYSCIGTGETGGVGNISVDPLFVDTASDNFHLQSGSPCIDTGTNVDWPLDDIEGNPRPIDGDVDGTPVTDMGAYEYVPPAQPELCPKEYRWSTIHKPPYKWSAKIFKSWNQVRFENKGPGNAYNVKATITWAPPNVTIVDAVVSLGDIPAGGSAWSSDDYALSTDTSKPSDPKLGIKWMIEYDDALGGHHVIENVPQGP